MRFHKVSLLLVAACSILPAQTLKTKFSVDPVPLFITDIQNFEIERSFLEGKTGLGFYLSNSGAASRRIDGHILYGSEQSALYKYYVENFDKSSLWVGGKLSLAGGTVFGGRGTASNVGTLGILAMSGYQLVLSNVFLNPFAGVGYALTNNFFGRSSYTGDVKETSLLLNYGLQIGFLF